jgi:hypothetical protein
MPSLLINYNMRNKLNKVINTLILLGVFHFYQSVMVENGREEIKGILWAMNEIITKNVHGGNRDRFEVYLIFLLKTNRLLIIPEDDYCQRSDTFKYYHPDIVLED